MLFSTDSLTRILQEIRTVTALIFSKELRTNTFFFLWFKLFEFVLLLGTCCSTFEKHINIFTTKNFQNFVSSPAYSGHLPYANTFNAWCLLNQLNYDAVIPN